MLGICIDSLVVAHRFFSRIIEVPGRVYLRLGAGERWNVPLSLERTLKDEKVSNIRGCESPPSKMAIGAIQMVPGNSC